MMNDQNDGNDDSDEYDYLYKSQYCTYKRHANDIALESIDHAGLSNKGNIYKGIVGVLAIISLLACTLVGSTIYFNK